MIKLSKTTQNFAVKRGLSIDIEENEKGQEEFWLYADTHQEAECWIVFRNTNTGLYYRGKMIGNIPEDMPIWIRDEKELRWLVNELSKTKEFEEVRD